MTTTDIHANALLVDLRVSQWTGRKIDKTATAQVAQINNVDSNVGTYYKSLIDGSALDPIKKHVGVARTYHYKMTLPWSDVGPRILPAASYFDYMATMQGLISEFESLYANFEAQYAFHRQEAIRKLGPLFNDSEYPDLHMLANKFAFQLNVTPLPRADDFRVDLGDAEVNRLRTVIEEQTRATVTSAVEDVYRRALKVVEAFIDRLGEEDNVFKSSLVGNARELVAIMPALNFTNDPVLADVCTRMEQALCAHEPEVLRTNMGARKKTHEAALAVHKDLMDFFGGGA